MDTLRVRLQRVVQGRYRVEHELGRGGMAVVYLGQDERLGRRVALKVFEREGGIISASERFLREIQVAAKLQHPNILPVFESGEGEELIYYVMPYVSGGSLRERIEREGPLPVADATRIAREVAEALDHAHRAGVVHRDIKPDNIMLADGVAVVADFGIARALEQAGGTVTDTGLAVGTAAYMSPEQASASPTVDGRTDIYALGCVLYEMLSGAPPFSGSSAQMIMARHMTDAVPPLVTVRKVPPMLDAAIQKALSKIPADRWPTGRSFASALASLGEVPTVAIHPVQRSRWLRQSLVGALTILLVTLGMVLTRPSSGPAAAVPILAVLPFTITGDSTGASFADGLNAAVSTGLVQVEGLGVVAGNRLEEYRGGNPRDVGRTLEATSVLTAGVQFVGNRFRVTAQLIDVPTGQSTWQQQFDGELVVNGRTGDVFAMIDSMTASIVDAVGLKLSTERRSRLARGVRTHDPQAYRIYLDARQALRTFAPESAQRAIELLNEALTRDSTFADAWVALAGALDMRHETSGGGTSATELAVAQRRAIDKAIELDSANGEAFAARAFQRLTYYWDHTGALSDARKSVRLAPASASVVGGYGNILAFLDEPDSAFKYILRSLQLDPTNGLASASWEASWVGRPDTALAWSARALQMDSLAVTAFWGQLHAFTALGQRANADSAAARFARSVEDPFTRALLADYYRRTSNVVAARQLLVDLEKKARQEFVPPSRIGAVLLALGNREAALDSLEASVRNRDPNLLFDFIEQYYSLAGQQRYEAVRLKVFGNFRVPANLYGERPISLKR